MRFPTGFNTEHVTEKIAYTDLPQPTPSGFAPAPRCSLDFYIELDDGTIIDDRTLRLDQFSGQEALSQPYEFSLNLKANTYSSSGLNQPWGNLAANSYGKLLTEDGSTSQKLDFQKILGAKACIRMGLPETDDDINKGQYPDERPVVYFNGIISNFSMAERGVYSASLKPALFKLTLQNNYRLFSQQTILDVVMQILSENNIDFNKSDLEQKPCKIVRGLANYRKQDWLQAGETDFDFINRLMQKVNLFYYFNHSNDKHTMVITDQPYYHSIYKREVNEEGRFEETHELKPLYLSYTHQQSLDRDDYITQFRYQQNLTTSGITTVLAQKEATWESQQTAQATPVYRDLVNTTEKLNMELLHVVQYGATEKEIEAITDTSMNRLVATRFDFSGASSCPDFKAGHKFLVKERDGDGSGSNDVPICPTIDGKEFVITSVQHQATAAGDYNNSFQASDAAGLATPFDSNTGNTGSILAQVVDNSAALQAQAEENDDTVSTTRHQGSSAKYLKKDVFSYDSKYFYFDEEAQETFHCKGIYVRFIDEPETATPHWVKLAEHMQTIPEIDSFVTIGRSNDNNEIPEVQQSLQAKGSKVIMPDDYTCNTNVGNSYSTNYGDSTSIGFGANVTTPLSTAKSIVELQRSSNNYNGVSYNESSSYGYSVTERSHNISRMGPGPDQPSNPADMMAYISYSDSAMYGNVYNKSKHIGESKSYNNQTGHSYSESHQTGGTTSVSTVDISTSTSQVGTSNSTSTVDTSNSVSSVNISNSASTVGMSNSASLLGMSNSASLTGMSNSASLTGMVNSANLTGMANSASLTGMSNNASLTGMSNSSSLTGSANSSSLTGSSVSSNLTGSSVSSNLTGSSVSSNITGSSTSSSITGSSNDMSITGSGTSLSIVGGGAATNIDQRPQLLMESTQAQIISAIKAVI